MRNYHGIIFAYQTTPELRELVSARSAASLPFCGRYRLIDFPLSSMRNAGILDCGVIMQRNYQSLLDHIGSGKAWDMSRRSGGLRMLPPFGLPEYHTGNYIGTIEALNAVSTYVRDIPQKHVVLMLGSMVANINFKCDALDKILNWEVGGVIPGMVIVVLLAFLVYGILLKCTKFGREVYMLGGNPMCARLCGVNARRISYTLYINCSVLGAISGIIYATRSMQGSLTALSGDQFTGLTAAILGGISFMGGSGGMGGTLIGLLVLKTFNKGMLISGGSTYLTSVLSGALLIVALTLDVFSRRRQRKRLGV